MAEDTVKIYVWPDKTWVSEEVIDDLDWYITSTGKSDDFSEYEVSLGLEYEDIDELISLNALPEMLPDKPIGLEHQGKVSVPEGAILIVHHSEDIEYNAVTTLSDKFIVNAPGIVVEVIMPKKEESDDA